jgi:beta-galactosidase
VHISQWGVAFTTPEVSEGKAIANVQVSVQNQTENVKEAEVKATLTNKEGKIVSTGQTKLNLTKDGENKGNISLPVTAPQLWSVDHPHLYTLSIKV